MNNAAIMGRDQALYDLEGIFDSLPNGQCGFRESLAQGFALQQFTNDVRRSVVKTDVIDGDDVGMIESCRGAGLQLETAEMIGIAAGTRPDEFQSNVASQPLVPCPENLSHGSGPDFLEDPVVTYDPAIHLQNAPLAC